jgi:hypothetical protein
MVSSQTHFAKFHFLFTFNSALGNIRNNVHPGPQ